MKLPVIKQEKKFSKLKIKSIIIKLININCILKNISKIKG
jgi:hypothetical protein